MKAEEKESGKQPPIRNAQRLACEYIRRPWGQVQLPSMTFISKVEVPMRL